MEMHNKYFLANRPTKVFHSRGLSMWILLPPEHTRKLTHTHTRANEPTY
jgi:hypothetical protein